MKKSAQMLVLTLLLSINFVQAQLVAVSNTKMNVIYIGVDNPIQVAVSDYAVEDISVEVSNGEIEGKNGQYTWKVNTPGQAEITVSAKDKVIETVKYRVKRIPDPVALVGNKSSGALPAAVLKAQPGVSAVLTNFDFDAVCNTTSYVITIVRKNSDPMDVVNEGAKFSARAKALIDTVQAGDIVYFENIRCQCPGDGNARKINSIAIKVQ